MSRPASEGAERRAKLTVAPFPPSRLVRYSFDAFRSIFPAGTVSGAPKIRAIELVADLEQERRGAYAGAVGHFDFAGDSMDTCIAIRTMTFKDGVAYLQAGGGIVFDSVEEDEYVETINKLGANVKCLEQAEGELLETLSFRRRR